MGTAATEVPVVEADSVDHDFADGWIEELRPGITVLKLYRFHGSRDDMEKVVFREVHLPTYAHDAAVQGSTISCVRGDCVRRVRGLKL